MNTEEKLFTAFEVAAVTGIDPDTTPRKQHAYSAMNAIHFAIINGLASFGLSLPVAAELASGIGMAASTVNNRGWVLVRLQALQPMTGCSAEDDPIWVDLTDYEAAMFEDFDRLSVFLAKTRGACMAMDIGRIETETISRMEAAGARRA